ncbi:hypothetical protein CDD80_1829 [Ophiocordyceps camponoti-rufipedis]|uniref:Uncharacterized protein n=1 Tax=Ophiocordyceps camponoti-rufipedis TaxID=2004952 RepID=A0A2C5XLC8_9HYPO|nr:hypothetical protein CDD80_1829 [Ophiocordyceps camponoti-rufipedis]
MAAPTAILSTFGNKTALCFNVTCQCQPNNLERIKDKSRDCMDQCGLPVTTKEFHDKVDNGCSSALKGIHPTGILGWGEPLPHAANHVGAPNGSTVTGSTDSNLPSAESSTFSHVHDSPVNATAGIVAIVFFVLATIIIGATLFLLRHRVANLGFFHRWRRNGDEAAAAAVVVEKRTSLSVSTSVVELSPDRDSPVRELDVVSRIPLRALPGYDAYSLQQYPNALRINPDAIAELPGSSTFAQELQSRISFSFEMPSPTRLFPDNKFPFDDESETEDVSSPEESCPPYTESAV